MTPTIAIFDIGKTNKKAFLFDDNYQIVWQKSDNLPETIDEDGFPCEDLDLLTTWVLDIWQGLQKNADFDIKAVNFSAYGASFVHLDKTKKTLTPLYNYLKPYPKKLQKKFYESYGEEANFAITTASPVLGNLNSGMQLYRLKHEKPEIFEQIKYSLHLPQYLSFLLSGEHCSDITSIGCHTNLWDFQRNQYHEWVNKEGIDKKLAPITNSPSLLGRGWGGAVAFGLHDSSAALIPYLASFSEPFVLISTGTWSISLNPFNDIPLTFEELEQDCLCYLSHQGKPVKASRLFAGNEHEEKIKELAELFSVDVNFYKNLSNRMPQTSSLEKAYIAFMAELVEKQVKSTNLVLKSSPVKKIFVDGGFSKNEIFMQLLAKSYPEIEIYAAEVSQASALGAAVAIHHSWNTKTIPQTLISLKKYTIYGI